MNPLETAAKTGTDAEPNEIYLGLDERRLFLKQVLAGAILFSVLINIYVLHHMVMKGIDRSVIIASSSVFFLGCIELALILFALRKDPPSVQAPNTIELTKLQHHAYLGKLSAGIFHDLVNRLTALILNVQRIPKDVQLPPKTAESIERAVQSAKRAESFITLVDTHIHFQSCADTFSLNSELEDVLILLKHELRKVGVEPELHSTEPIWIEGEALAFHQAILGLSFAILQSKGARSSASSGTASTKPSTTPSKNSVFQIVISRSRKYIRISLRYHTSNTLAKSISKSAEFHRAKLLIQSSFKGQVLHSRRLERGSIVLQLPSDTIRQAKLPDQNGENTHDADSS